jgi:hypothetical protein
LEATLRAALEIVNQFQSLTRASRWPRWIPLESGESTQRNPLATEATSGSHPRCALPEGIDSRRKNGLTFLAPLTYPLIIEELRPEETPHGRF